jgi:GTP-binding protein HflX
MYVVYETLNQLEVGDKPVVTLFNKIDRLAAEEDVVLKDLRAEKTLQISAKQEIGLEAVKETIEDILRQSKMLIERVFDYSHAGDIAVIRKYGQLLEEEYRADGIFVRAYVPKDVYAQLEF